jgi:hypothetical protein
MSATVLALPESVSGLFEDAPKFGVPAVTDRYDYKKDPGSSDTRHQEDDIRN